MHTILDIDNIHICNETDTHIHTDRQTLIPQLITSTQGQNDLFYQDMLCVMNFNNGQLR